MKKVIFLGMCYFLFTNVCLANEVVDLVTITDKCYVVNDMSVTIPVKIVSKNDGNMSSIIDTYSLGMIDNNDDVITRLSKIETMYISNLRIDYNKDSDGRSYVYYKLNNDINLETKEELVSFNLDIEFKNNLPNRFYLFNNEIVLSESKEFCEYINGYKNEVIEKTVYIEKEVDYSEVIASTIIKVVGVIVVLIGICGIIFIKVKK